jgi:hypothetical protein
MVESQEQVATMELVAHDHHKQFVLEKLLDDSKPPYFPGTEHLDPLLRSPWRYSPLDYGSRFGTIAENSIFYGGLSLEATLAESAYYRWVFYFGREREVMNSVISQHSLFEAKYRCELGYQLQSSPFDQYDGLRDPRDYRDSQALGALLRRRDVDGFEYKSARDPDGGLCIALLSPSALESTKVHNMKNWICTTNATTVSFKMSTMASAVYFFSIDDFLAGDTLPMPST